MSNTYTLAANLCELTNAIDTDYQILPSYLDEVNSDRAYLILRCLSESQRLAEISFDQPFTCDVIGEIPNNIKFWVACYRQKSGAPYFASGQYLARAFQTVESSIDDIREIITQHKNICSSANNKLLHPFTAWSTVDVKIDFETHTHVWEDNDRFPITFSEDNENQGEPVVFQSRCIAYGETWTRSVQWNKHHLYCDEFHFTNKMGEELPPQKPRRRAFI